MSDRGGGGGGGGDIEVKLCVVSIAMELYSMPADDMTKGEHVDGEEGWTEHRALGDPTPNSVGVGFGVLQDHELVLPVRYEKPLEGGARDTNVVLEAVKEEVINSIKCSREVEQDEEGSGAGFRGHQEVIGDSDENCLSAMKGTKAGLEFFVETV